MHIIFTGTTRKRRTRRRARKNTCLVTAVTALAEWMSNAFWIKKMAFFASMEFWLWFDVSSIVKTIGT